jgi:hypothetical protein
MNRVTVFAGWAVVTATYWGAVFPRWAVHTATIAWRAVLITRWTVLAAFSRTTFLTRKAIIATIYWVAIFARWAVLAAAVSWRTVLTRWAVTTTSSRATILTR